MISAGAQSAEKANLPPRADWGQQQSSVHWSPSETWPRSVKKSHLERQQSDLVAFGFQRLATPVVSEFPMDELPLIVLWNSCGKMPLGASWWKIQRRNCLATPAALPGSIMLALTRERKHKESWSNQREFRYLFTYLFTYTSVLLWNIPLSFSLVRWNILVTWNPC